MTRKLLRIPDDSALSTVAYTPDGADDLTDRDSLHRQYVSDPLLAQTIGIQGITAQFQGTEVANNCNLFLTLCVKVISNDGATVRATLLAITRDTTNELPLTASIANRNFPSANTTSYTCVAGDRLLVEVGVGGNITSGTGGSIGHDASLRWGCLASSGDLPANDSETGATFRPWIEFAGDLAWTVMDDEGAWRPPVIVATALTALLFVSGIGPAAEAGAPTIVDDPYWWTPPPIVVPAPPVAALPPWLAYDPVPPAPPDAMVEDEGSWRPPVLVTARQSILLWGHQGQSDPVALPTVVEEPYAWPPGPAPPVVLGSSLPPWFVGEVLPGQAQVAPVENYWNVPIVVTEKSLRLEWGHHGQSDAVVGPAGVPADEAGWLPAGAAPLAEATWVLVGQDQLPLLPREDYEWRPIWLTPKIAPLPIGQPDELPSQAAAGPVVEDYEWRAVWSEPRTAWVTLPPEETLYLGPIVESEPGLLPMPWQAAPSTLPPWAWAADDLPTAVVVTIVEDESAWLPVAPPAPLANALRLDHQDPLYLGSVDEVYNWRPVWIPAPLGGPVWRVEDEIVLPIKVDELYEVSSLTWLRVSAVQKPQACMAMGWVMGATLGQDGQEGNVPGGTPPPPVLIYGPAFTMPKRAQALAIFCDPARAMTIQTLEPVGDDQAPEVWNTINVFRSTGVMVPLAGLTASELTIPAEELGGGVLRVATDGPAEVRVQWLMKHVKMN